MMTNSPVLSRCTPLSSSRHAPAATLANDTAIPVPCYAGEARP